MTASDCCLDNQLKFHDYIASYCKYIYLSNVIRQVNSKCQQILQQNVS